VGSGTRYFFDEHLPTAAANALRAVGADVLTIDEAGRASLPDDEQLRFATADARVVVTHDDYLTLAAAFWAAGEEFAGVAYCHQLKYYGNVRGLIHALLRLNRAMPSAAMRNKVEYL
jgi:hypothetical protein